MTNNFGLFISLEGIDGSGKTTQLTRLKELFDAKSINYVATREPGGSPAGERIRDILLNSNDLHLEPRAELYLFLANRVQNLNDIVKPALAEGKIVVTDRHRDSSIAFQGGGRELGVDWVDELHTKACDLVPDCTLLFDITVEESRRRAIERGRFDPASITDRFEREDRAFHERIAAAYQTLAKKYPERFVTIDASQKIDDVTKEMCQKLVDRYPAQLGSLIS